MFDFNQFDAQCATMSTEQLISELQHTTTDTNTTCTEKRHSGLGFLDSLSAHHNQKKKKHIIEKHLKAHDVEASSHIEHADVVPTHPTPTAPATPTTEIKPMTVAEYHQQRASMDQHQQWQNTHGGHSPTAQSPNLSSSSCCPKPHSHHHHHHHHHNPDGTRNPKRDSLKCHTTRISASPAAPLTPPDSDEALDEHLTQFALPESVIEPVGCGHTGACGNPVDGTCAFIFPGSALYQSHPHVGPETRHVHFAV